MPAATTASSSHIDPFKTSKFNVQLGSSLQFGSSSEKPRAIVTFNHKPQQTASKRKATLKRRSSNEHDYELLLEDEKDKDTQVYKYAGRRLSDNDSYILMLNNDQQTFTLESVYHEYAMNLTATPQESNARKLRQEYGEIPTGQISNGPQDSDAEHYLSDEDADEPDLDNPFDYRHYLNETKPSITANSPILTSVPVLRQLTPTETSSTNTAKDLGAFTKSSATQRSTPSNALRSAPAKPRALPKEAKAATIKRGPGRKPNSSSMSKPAEGEIIIETSDQKKSANQKESRANDSIPSFEGLLIEVDPELERKKKKRRNLLGTPSGGGPISLHSITKSPVPTFAPSPPAMERSNTNELASGGSGHSNGNGSGYDGEDDDEDHSRRQPSTRAPKSNHLLQHSTHQHHHYAARERDVDVDQLELPSPAVVAARNRQRRESTWDADDAADFEAELEQAFEESGVEDAADDADADADADADDADAGARAHPNDRDTALNATVPMDTDSRGAIRPAALAPQPPRVTLASAHESEEESEEE